MPPTVALFLWLLLLLTLLRFDPAKHVTDSPALWVPVIWFFIIGSRLPSQWLDSQTAHMAEALEEGNSLDRAIYLALILLAIGILMSRRFGWGEFFRSNVALMAFISFALLSVVWSDYPFVTFKRWFRDLGNYLVILVTLSDTRPLEAVRCMLRRLCFLLIPLSVLLIKYFPELARQYDPWTGVATYAGATTSKNMLGVLCLVSGLFFFWDILTRWVDRTNRRTRRIILVNVAFLAMTLWLLQVSDSATSRLCLAIGGAVIAAAHTKTAQHSPAVLTVLLPCGICLYLTMEFVLDIDVISAVAKAVGRNPNLTGRTEIWEAVLGTHTNPLFGTGYESFWLGPRLHWVWQKAGMGPINEAHNGYLEIYLSLGFFGLLFLSGFLIASYRTICRRFATWPGPTSLSLALWTVLLSYNVTESAFKMHLMWVAFLLSVIVVPAPIGSPSNVTASSANSWSELREGST